MRKRNMCQGFNISLLRNLLCERQLFVGIISVWYGTLPLRRHFICRIFRRVRAVLERNARRGFCTFLRWNLLRKGNLFLRIGLSLRGKISLRRRLIRRIFRSGRGMRKRNVCRGFCTFLRKNLLCKRHRFVLFFLLNKLP